MSFRNRLTFFFVVIVIVPMIAVAVVLFRLIADNETGKSDAAVAARAQTALKLYTQDAQTPAGADAAATVARDGVLGPALAAGDMVRARQRAIQLVGRGGLARIALLRGGATVFDVGDSTAIAPVVAKPVRSPGPSARPARGLAHDGRRLRPPGQDDRQRARGGAPRGFGDRHDAAARDAEAAAARWRTSPSCARPVSAIAPSRSKRRVSVGDRWRSRCCRTSGTPRRPSREAVCSPAGSSSCSSSPPSRWPCWCHARSSTRWKAFCRRRGAWEAATSPHMSRSPGTTSSRRSATSSTRCPTSWRSACTSWVSSRDGWRDRCGASARRSPSNLDRDGLLQIVLRTAVDGVGARGGRASVRDGERFEERVRSGDLQGGEQALEAVEAAVLEAGEPRDIQLDGVSALGHPLSPAADGRARARAAVGRPRTDRPFNDSERDLFHYLAGQAAVSIENVDLHERVQHQAVTDELTGLYNHRRFQEAIVTRGRAGAALRAVARAGHARHRRLQGG